MGRWLLEAQVVLPDVTQRGNQELGARDLQLPETVLSLVE